MDGIQNKRVQIRLEQGGSLSHGENKEGERTSGSGDKFKLKPRAVESCKTPHYTVPFTLSLFPQYSMNQNHLLRIEMHS